MSKVLVVDNEASLAEKIHKKIWTQGFGGSSQIDSQQANRIIDKVFDVLKDYEVKAVEFEAEVSPHIDYAKSTTGQDVRFHGRCILLDDRFKIGDKLRAFVVKKREKADEKDAPHS